MRKFWHNYLTEDEFKVVLFLVIVFGLGLCLELTGFGYSKPEEAEIIPDLSNDYEIKYDLRTITFEELVTVPGIGPKRAEDILEYRESSSFSSKLDLIQVKGIGKTTLAKIEKYFLDFGVEYNPDLISANTDSPETQNISLRLDLNKAEIDDLVKLKGIGPSKAEKIINLRKQLGKFSTVEDILQVKGIGPKTLEKFRDNVYVGGDSEE